MAVTIRGSGQVPVQVVSSTLTTSFSTSSTTPVATGLTATITPTNSANKILVILNAGVLGSSASANFLTLNRAGTNIAVSTGYTNNITSGVSVNGGGGAFYQGGLNFLDSPATTSATTYSLYMSVDSGTGTLNKRQADNFVGGVSTITLMEIAYA
jgi:hypothetical protein